MKNVRKAEKSTLAKNFIKRRKELGYQSAEALAAISGVGLTTIKEIETDKSEGNPATRRALEAALQCTWEDLWQRPPSMTQQQMIELIAMLQSELDSLKRQMAYGRVASPSGVYTPKPKK